MIKASVYVHQLRFRFPFRIAHGVREATDVVYVNLEYNGHTAWGEAALPPYLGHTTKDVPEAIKSFADANRNLNLDEWHRALQQTVSNMPARAAMDMAWWQLTSKIQGVSVPQLLGVQPTHQIPHTYTIASSLSLADMKERYDFGYQNGFRFFKLKLISEDCSDTIDWYKELSQCPFAIDANQSWQSFSKATDNLRFLKSNGCIFVEQPFIKDDLQNTMALKAANILPLFADESCQRQMDISSIASAFSGVNIKLMKSGGVTEALKMIHHARNAGMQILIGCMSESSVGCKAAEWLAPLCDYADLDGTFLITNDFDEAVHVS